jgi:hypothetical protein
MTKEKNSGQTGKGGQIGLPPMDTGRRDLLLQKGCWWRRIRVFGDW